MRLYLTGSDGMLGTALRAALAGGEWTVKGVSHKDHDIADADAVACSIREFGPDVVVHAAAHAIVDDCENDPKLAMRVNIAGVRNVVEACRETGARLVYISSDYVFDGIEPPEGGYTETDTPNPVSVYGLTKLAGERIASALPDSLIVRTSWLFGGTDERTDNVLAMVGRARAGLRSELIDDQFSCPTYTVDLAAALVHLLTLAPAPAGTVHVANAGAASWHQVGVHTLATLGEAVAADLGPDAIALADCKFDGGRPVNSALSTARLAGLGHRMPHWTDGIERFIAALEERR
ncbi:dTDP-4-dehydrorhamnose reductase [Amycolatopsis sp. NPDC059657]|uniref:dTDP-4-dehydrorhamnose reductase n=1 Tax=Amycolatopsis sp. NPDC059657 TaxID=3346899 RepID=UPI00366CE958